MFFDFSIDQVREYLEEYFKNALHILGENPELVVELCVLCVQCLEVSNMLFIIRNQILFVVGTNLDYTFMTYLVNAKISL